MLASYDRLEALIDRLNAASPKQTLSEIYGFLNIDPEVVTTLQTMHSSAALHAPNAQEAVASLNDIYLLGFSIGLLFGRYETTHDSVSNLVPPKPEQEKS